jgi:GntR family transcriptional regulator/MocR family aminotransferase
VLLDPGDRVVLEEPHYIALWRIFMAHGARVETVAVDEEGLDCAQLPDDAPRLVCVTPSHQFPLGSVCRCRGDWPCCDTRRPTTLDPRGRLRRRVPLRRRAARGAAVTRCPRSHALYRNLLQGIVPGVAHGLHGVAAALREPFRIAKQLSTFGCPAIEQRALAQFIENRGFERHLRRAAQTLRARRAALIDGLREHARDAVELRDSQAECTWWHGCATSTKRAATADRQCARTRRRAAPYRSQLPAAACACRLLLGYAGLAPKEISAAMVRFGDALRAA